MAAEHIRQLQDLRPGDIMFGPNTWLVGMGEFIVDGGFRVGPLDVRHVGIVTEANPGMRYTEEFPDGIIDDFKLVQAMPGGAEEVSMTYAQHWTPKHAYARMPEDYPGQAADAAAIARLMVAHNVGYAWDSYAALALWHWGFATPKLEAWIGRRQEPVMLGNWAVSLPVEAICSVLADQAWSLTGKQIMTGVPHQCVTPSQLGSKLLTGMEDVVWGWPSVIKL